MNDSEIPLDRWMRAIAKAERAKDAAAVQDLKRRAQASITGEGSFTERVGAGAMDVVKNVGRYAGLTSKADTDEQNRIASMADPGGWGRLAGQALALSPTLLVPGAATIGGGAAIGAGQGALMEPDDPLKGATIGALTGGGGAAALKYLPKAYNATMNQVAERTPFLGDRKQAIAEKAFREVIPEADHAGVLAKLQAHQDPTHILPGFQQTTAAATRNPDLLRAERQLRSAGQPYGAPLAERAGEQGAAVNRAWTEEFGGGGSGAIRELRDAVTGMHKEDMALHATPNRRSVAPVLKAFDAELETAIGTHRDKLLEMRASLLAAAKLAAKSGSVEPLDAWRRVQLKQQLGQLYERMGGNYAPDAAGFLQRSLERIKPTFDETMDRLTGGGKSYSKLIGDYHQLSKEAGQAAAGEDWLTKLRAKPEMAAEGVHNPLTDVQRGLRAEFAAGPTPTTRYGTPTYNPQQEYLLKQTRDALEAARTSTGAADIVPPGSSTAANLAPMQRVLQKAANAQAETTKPFQMSDLRGGALGAMMGGPMGAIIGYGAEKALTPVRAAALDNIAKRLVTMFTDPQAAAAALARAPDIPGPVKKAIMERIVQLGSYGATIGATNPQ